MPTLLRRAQSLRDPGCDRRDAHARRPRIRARHRVPAGRGDEGAAAVHAVGSHREGGRDDHQDRAHGPGRLRRRLVRARAGLDPHRQGDGERRGRRRQHDHLERRQGADRGGLGLPRERQHQSARTLVFTVRQYYSDGSVVDWSGPESSDTPAPTRARRLRPRRWRLDRHADDRGARARGGGPARRRRRASSPGGVPVA